MRPSSLRSSLIRYLALVFCLTVVFRSQILHADEKPVIQKVTVTADSSNSNGVQIDIFGQGFGSNVAPDVTLDGIARSVRSFTDTQVALSPIQIAAGAYALRVTRKPHAGEPQGNDENRTARFDVTIGTTGPKGDKGDEGPSAPLFISAFLPGSLNTPYSAADVVIDKDITVTRIVANLRMPVGSSCLPAVLRVGDATSGQDLLISAGQNTIDSGPMIRKFMAGTRISLKLQAATNCSAPSDANMLVNTGVNYPTT